MMSFKVPTIAHCWLNFQVCKLWHKKNTFIFCWWKIISSDFVWEWEIAIPDGTQRAVVGRCGEGGKHPPGLFKPLDQRMAKTTFNWMYYVLCCMGAGCRYRVWVRTKMGFVIIWFYYEKQFWLKNTRAHLHNMSSNKVPCKIPLAVY